MPITRTAWIDDDGTGTTGTPINNAEKTILYNQIDAALLDAAGRTNAAPVTTTGSITALPLPAGGGDQTIYLNNASLTTIHGITAGLPNQRVTIVPIGAGQVNLVNLSGSAGSVNMRLYNAVSSAPTSVMPNSGAATYVFDGVASGLWRLIQHEQGLWITPLYSAANFAAVGAMTWTVDAGDIVTLRYRLSGRTIQVEFLLSTTTVGGTLNNALYMISGAWGGFSAVAQVSVRLAYATDNGAAVHAFGRTNAATVVQLYKADISNWVASTNNTSIEGQLTFDVT